MNRTSEISVTLTPGLFARLKAEAGQLEVSLEWLVASLVVDTMEAKALQLVPVPACASSRSAVFLIEDRLWVCGRGILGCLAARTRLQVRNVARRSSDAYTCSIQKRRRAGVWSSPRALSQAPYSWRGSWRCSGPRSGTWPYCSENARSACSGGSPFLLIR